MRDYTAEKLLQRVNTMGHKELLAIMTKLLRSSPSPAMRKRLAKLILGTDFEVDDTRVCFIGNDRTVPYRVLQTLSESPMMGFVKEIVLAALDPRGPFQSREIMMLADQIKGGKSYFITANGIPQTAKNQAGHILSMAGFERVSHYDRERKMPVKAWKIKHGWTGFTAEQRADIVYATIKQELQGTAQTPAPQTTLGSFL